jgi:hypothetical protein
MKVRTLLGLALAAVLAFPQWSHAQEYEQSESVELANVYTWHIDPADMGTFMSAVEMIAKAARQANLGETYSWHMWQDIYSFTIVTPFVEAELMDPEHWMKQYMGTPGEATLMAAFQEFEKVDMLGATSEMHQAMPAWSYMPEGMSMPPMAWVRVHEFWVKGGQENDQKWNALIGEFMAFFKDIGYPYPIWGNMVRYGENRNLFVAAYDDPSAYVGANSVEAIAKKHGKAEQWEGLLMRLSQLTLRAESTDLQYMPAQSYMPQMEQTGSR